MSEQARILSALKQSLKEKGLTYKKVGEALSLSESSVKRLFHLGDMPFSRLVAMAHLAKISLQELSDLANKVKSPISHLSIEQEKVLAARPILIMVTYLLVNRWPLENIIHHYQIKVTEMIQLLTTLSQLKLIELLPGNKVRLLTAKNFSWHPHGPIQKFFQALVQKEFFESNFSANEEKLHFVVGALSRDSLKKVYLEMNKFIDIFDELSQKDARLPLAQRENFSLVLALRNWEPELFRKLRK